ncbi:Shikimate dehydrogenase [Thiomonas sp. X19]|uniref:shikimate dehydrogenase n=1 Tax=Thiomonas sp. X19 TaxID=1050370 RepID=UPI000B72A938|nr:shikimate dehydrogenase [Thiomonas sp. X19]SCC92744.1 Shikimate dehydrogenase [Thiomonas sp. X19]
MSSPTPRTPMPIATHLPDLYAVLGNPVEHSKSPRIHALFAAQCGLSLRYEKRLVALDGFAHGLQAFRAESGHGCNVTVPFKFEAARAARRLSPRAALAEAANTLGWGDDGELWGDNTDGIGLVRDLTRILMRAPGSRQAASAEAHPLAGRTMLLLGSGGAASGVLGALIEAGAQAIAVWNRSADKAHLLVARHAGVAREHGVALAAVTEPAPGFDLVINATASSLGGATLELPPGVLRPGMLAYDLMYAAQATAFIAQARKAGADAQDGLSMLVEQAAESFWLWHGVRPDTAPVLATLQAELRGRSD